MHTLRAFIQHGSNYYWSKIKNSGSELIYKNVVPLCYLFTTLFFSSFYYFVWSGWSGYTKRSALGLHAAIISARRYEYNTRVFTITSEYQARRTSVTYTEQCESRGCEHSTDASLPRYTLLSFPSHLYAFFSIHTLHSRCFSQHLK